MTGSCPRMLLILLLAGVDLSPAPADESDSPPKPSDRLLIVAPDSFSPSLKEFIAHKQTLRTTVFVSLETALNSGVGTDDPEKLKQFLYDEWKQRGLGYVLLVGDVSVMPVRYMVLDRVTPAAFDYAFYPSDLYYSDLARDDKTFDDWNATKTDFHAGYFGEVRGEKYKQDVINYDQIDYRPDIAVGRWPVETPEEAERVALKTVAYEQTVIANKSPHLHRAAFLSVGGWVDSRDFMDQQAAKLDKGWQSEKRFYRDGRRQDTAPPDHDAVRSLLNDGLGLAVHAGHGQSDAWDQCFSVADLEQLTNAGQLPVVISAGCSTAYFAPLPPYGAYVDVNGTEHNGSDQGEQFTAPPAPPSPYQHGRFNPTGLGEEFLKRSANGAVAYIGCNTGSQPCGLTLVDGFVTSLAESPQPHLGDCWSDAVRHYYKQERLAELQPNDDWYPPSIFFQGMKFMLFGDPSLTLPANVR